MINRTIEPEVDFSLINDFLSDKIIEHEYKTINGIPCYFLDRGEQDLVKIELTFDAGSIYQKKPFVAYSTFQMLTEGTCTMTSSQISERLDFYGAFIEKEVDRDFASVSLYTLTKHLKYTLLILNEILTKPIFPESDLSIYKEKQKSILEVNKKQVSFLARTNFLEIIFGKQHPYGVKIDSEDIDKLSSEDLTRFYTDNINADNCSIIVSGKINNEVIKLIEENFQTSEWRKSNRTLQKKVIEIDLQSKFSEHFIEQPNVVQSAIRIGRVLFNYNNPDYNKFQILNTVLGGYFGSRLMKNIREDKGFTYGIGSAILPLKHSGYFFITTEVGKEYTNDTINEIYREIENLQSNYIKDDELNLVKNYKFGELMRSLDGTFAISDYLKKTIQHKLPINYYKNVLDDIYNTSKEDILLLAQKYLKKELLTQLVVGQN
jgi:predicted Zn-dependent peptidase